MTPWSTARPSLCPGLGLSKASMGARPKAVLPQGMFSGGQRQVWATGFEQPWGNEMKGNRTGAWSSHQEGTLLTHH